MRGISCRSKFCARNSKKKKKALKTQQNNRKKNEKIMLLLHLCLVLTSVFSFVCLLIGLSYYLALFLSISLHWSSCTLLYTSTGSGCSPIIIIISLNLSNNKKYCFFLFRLIQSLRPLCPPPHPASQLLLYDRSLMKMMLMMKSIFFCWLKVFSVELIFPPVVDSCWAFQAPPPSSLLVLGLLVHVNVLAFGNGSILTIKSFFNLTVLICFTTSLLVFIHEILNIPFFNDLLLLWLIQY